MSDKCAFCSGTADFWCDFVLGFSTAGYEGCTGEDARRAGRFSEFVPGHGLPHVGRESELFTCDAPLCAQCRTVIGMSTISGVPDSVDRCPRHHNILETDMACCITAHEADRLRNKVWAIRVFSPAASSAALSPPHSAGSE